MSLPSLSRDEAIESVEWLTADSGYGFGVCSFANSIIWSEDRPSDKKRDLRSVVFLGGAVEDYTDVELALLGDFARRKTANYDDCYRYRRGCNAIIIEKQLRPGGTMAWMRKRLSWVSGPMFSHTLIDALALFERDMAMEGKFVILDNSEIYRLVEPNHGDGWPEKDYIGEKQDGEQIAISTNRAVVVAPDQATALEMNQMRLVELQRNRRDA